MKKTENLSKEQLALSAAMYLANKRSDRAVEYVINFGADNEQSISYREVYDVIRRMYLEYEAKERPDDRIYSEAIHRLHVIHESQVADIMKNLVNENKRLKSELEMVAEVND